MTTVKYLHTIAPLTQSDLYDIDDLTANIMDELRAILIKYEKHYPDWTNDDIEYNLDDKIYWEIHSEILHNKTK